MKNSQKLSAINQLQTSVREYCSIMLSKIDKAVVYDELLMHRAFALLMLSDGIENAVAWYFQYCPVPYAVINFVDSTPSVISRVIGRNKSINTLKNMSNRDIEHLYLKSALICSVAEKVLIPICNQDNHNVFSVCANYSS
jgi:hypothetical protein